MTKILASIFAGASLMFAALPASATEIDFTGGSAMYFDGSSGVTNNAEVYFYADYYVENGYKVSNTGGVLNVGNYYGLGNDVMHTHWARNGGGVTEVRVARLDGAAFDLNSFDVSSNNRTGGTADGTELTYIHASLDGVHVSYSVLLPPENWGGSLSTVLLGAQFDHIKAFWFTSDDHVDCIGIDNLVMADAGPGQVPEPGSLALFSLAFAGLCARRRTLKRRGKGMPRRAWLAGLALMLAGAAPAHASTIDFTGGTAAMNNGWAGITSNDRTFSDLAVYYSENTEGVLSFYPRVSEGFAGDYYGAGNDVLHADWSANAVAGEQAFLAYKRYGESLDFNSFTLITNTANMYGQARGTERVFLHASTDFIHSSYTLLMPSEDWNFPGTRIILGEQFKNIKAFWFTADPGVSFAIDDVVIDEAGLPAVPEPGSLALLGLALACLAGRRRS